MISFAPNRAKLTLRREGYAELEEKKSLFIAHAAPVNNEDEAREYIDFIKSQYTDASHNVYAYYLNGGAAARYSDDGEPQGTAGMPVLNVLKMSEGEDIAVVVTRYFGGTLLGAGGLVRAYGAAAKAALDDGEIVAIRELAVFRASMSYSEYQRIGALLERSGARERSSEFTDRVTLIGVCPKEMLESVSGGIAEITSGKVKTEFIRLEFAAD